MFPKEALTPRRAPWAELLRLLILVSAALAVMAPYFTGNLVGGVDARWYGYMLGDYIEQVRQGHVLVTVGQGPLAWNGSVHLYRSAPVYMALARLVDFATFRHLNIFALQHATAIASAVAGTLGFYAAAAKVIPERRFAAMGFSLLYLLTPSWLSTVVHAEAYMSFMAFAALPVVLYGNARTVLRDDGKGYVILGAGLALVWMCHPPIAFLSTMATVFIQCGLIAGRGVVSWANLLKGAALFGILAAYYFASMSELPPDGPTGGLRHDVAAILGVMMCFTGMGRFALGGRSLGWAACALGGLILLGLTNHPWLCWALATLAVWAVLVAIGRAVRPVDLGRHGFTLLFVAALAGAAIAEGWVGRDGIFLGAILNLADNNAHFGSWLRPLSTPAEKYMIFQPGWGLDGCIVLGALALAGRRPLGAKLFFAATVGLLLCFFRIPLASNFIVGRFPTGLASMCGVPLDLRMAPVIASFAAMGGVMWLATTEWTGPASRAVVGCSLGVFVLWGGYQSRHLSRHVREATSNAFYTDLNLRSENTALDAYAYLLLPVPSYYSNGKMDPMIESRLLNDQGRVLVGPMQDAAAMEAEGATRRPLTAELLPNSKLWYTLGGPITVEPGEHLLLRFDFDPASDCRGFLVLKAEHAYREYHLPDSGLERGFGAGGERTSVISLWNSGATPEHYSLMLSTVPGNTYWANGASAGSVFVSKLEPSKLQIEVTSLIPYRARVSTVGGTLETFRVFMPGYRAKVDGVEVPVAESRERLVSFRIPPGTHEVELSFVGSRRLWLSALVSGLGWIGLLGSCLLQAVRRRRRAPG